MLLHPWILFSRDRNLLGGGVRGANCATILRLKMAQHIDVAGPYVVVRLIAAHFLVRALSWVGDT